MESHQPLSQAGNIPAEDTPFAYSVCGLSVRANHAIPWLQRAPASAGQADLRLVTHEIPEWLCEMPPDTLEPFFLSRLVDRSGRPLLRAWTLGGGAFVRLVHGDGTQYVVERAGTGIWMMPSPADAADGYDFLLEFVLAFVLRLRGVVCLHAAAVVMEGRAIALGGQTGVGKSTLAAALGRRGHPVLTDDVAAVARSGSVFLCYPGPSRLRPRRRASSLRRTEDGSPIAWTPPSEYADVDLSSAAFVQPREPAVLDAVVFLEPGNGVAGARFEPVRPAGALIRLLGESWARQLQDPRMRAQEFEEVSSLVCEARVSRLVYDGASGAWVADACKALEATFCSRRAAVVTGEASR